MPCHALPSRKYLASTRSRAPTPAGNPQVLGQKPITFFRQVLSLCDYPEVSSSRRATSGALGQ
jgi:hypothetical protein